jgi:RimJ/RimL family protein N-acetyltransferase
MAAAEKFGGSTAASEGRITAMPFEHVRARDRSLVQQATEFMNAALVVDDPAEPLRLPELVSLKLAYGGDLEPPDYWLYTPEGAPAPVGVLSMYAPQRDNRHLVMGGVVVHPQHRRRGHGSAMVAELVRRTAALGRTTIWSDCAEDDSGTAAFLKLHDFSYASHEARRYQRLAELDHTEIRRRAEEARKTTADYEIVRIQTPTDPEVLAELIEVTAAINDAPMGDLDFEHERFDLKRLQDSEFSAQVKGLRLYRVSARHRRTGAVSGHTVLGVQPRQPTWGLQGDTAVHRDHRGHRLGLLLKIDMMAWMAEAEPQLEVVETWNHADNSYMINVNEAIGYRLSRVFDDYQRVLP